MASEIRVRRTDDATLCRFFKAAKDAGNRALSEIKEKNIEIEGSNHKINLVFTTGLPWEPSEQDLAEAPAGQFAIQRVTLQFEVSQSSQQGKQNRYNLFTVKRDGTNMICDTFTIEQNNPNILTSEGAKIVQRDMHQEISTLLGPISPEDGSLIPTLSNLAESFATTYQRISSELSNVVIKVNEERTQQINEFKEERKRLREEIARERNEILDAAEKKVAQQREEIEDEERKITQERGQLDISRHKDARRRQFQKLQSDLTDMMQKPVASRELQATRWAVFISVILAGVVAGFYAYGSIVAGIAMESTSDNGRWIFTAIRSSIFTLASLASFYGAAAWLRYFYVRDLQSQEELQRFKNDMARASWVMDAALEIRKEHDEQIPPEWLTGVTEGLFSRGHGRSTDEEGAEALGALLGLSASARLGPDGLSLDLSKKGRREIAEAARRRTKP